MLKAFLLGLALCIIDRQIYGIRLNTNIIIINPYIIQVYIEITGRGRAIPTKEEFLDKPLLHAMVNFIKNPFSCNFSFSKVIFLASLWASDSE